MSDCSVMGCSSPGSCVHGILLLLWVYFCFVNKFVCIIFKRFLLGYQYLFLFCSPAGFVGVSGRTGQGILYPDCWNHKISTVFSLLLQQWSCVNIVSFTMMEKMLLWENMLPFLVALAKFLREGEKQQNQRTKVTRETQRIKSRQVGGGLS